MSALLQLQHYALAAHLQEVYQPLMFVRSKFSSPAWLSVASSVSALQRLPPLPALALAPAGTF